MNMPVSTFTNGKWKQNSFVVVSGKINTAIVIDPGYEDTHLVQKLVELQTTQIVILLTHAHIDHVGYASELKKLFSADIYLCEYDSMLLKQVNVYAKFMGNHPKIEVPKIENFFNENNIPEIFEQLGVKVIFTPGHTDGSVSYLIQNFLFSGDLIFQNQTGRSDLPGGDPQKMRTSIKKIIQLDSKIVVFPGHGGPFILGDFVHGEIF